MGILWIFGIIIAFGIVFLILNHYFEGMVVGIWLANFISWTTLLSVVFVWMFSMGISSRDFAYMEGHLLDQKPETVITNPKFIELYIQYKNEHKYWITRQFQVKPSQALVKLFEKGYTTLETIER